VVLIQGLRSALAAAMQLSEDLNIELEALHAIYDSAVTVMTDTAEDHSRQRSETARGSPSSQVELQLQLAPQTGGDESSVYVLATLGISVPLGYPQQPPICSLVTAKGSAVLLSQAAASP
jgi:RWD domain